MSELVELAKKALQAQKRKAPDIQAHNQAARGELDAYFSQVIVPQLTHLHSAGRLPDLAQCPLWTEAEQLWGQAAVNSPVPCDVEKVKDLMAQVVAQAKTEYDDKGGDDHA